MHAPLSLFVGVLLLFSRHVLAAPSDDRGVGERPPGQQAAGTLHHMHHMDVYGRQIQKRQDDGNQSPAGVDDLEDDTQSPETPVNEVGAPNEEPTAPAKTETSKEEEPNPDNRTHENKHNKKDKIDLSCTKDNGEQKCASVLGAKCGGGRQRALCIEGECTCGSPGPDDSGTSPFPAGTLPFPAYVECNNMATNKYLPRDPLVSAVNWFCEDADGRGHDENSGGITRTYYGLVDEPGTADKVNIGVDWPVGYGENPDKAECLEALMFVVDRCSVPSGDDNKANMKAGGSYRLPSNRAFTYWIQPTFPRFDYNKPIDGKCECYTKGQGGVHQDCRIWGRGWKGVSSDNGQGFKDNTKGCYKWSNTWNFDYIDNEGDDNMWEWEAFIQLNLEQEHCLWRAMQNVGAPAHVGCRTGW